MRRRYGIRKPDGELAAGINEPTPGRAVGAFTRSQEGAPPWQHCWHEGYRIAVLPSVGPGKHVTLSRDNAQAVSEQHEALRQMQEAGHIDITRGHARPRCFESDAEWQEWLDYAVISSRGTAAVNPCVDCTVKFRLRMQAEGRCHMSEVVQAFRVTRASVKIDFDVDT